MIILDTNIISEPCVLTPRLRCWPGSQPNLEAAARAMFEKDFADRVLPFDTSAAPFYAQIAQRAAWSDAQSPRSMRRSPPSRVRGAQHQGFRGVRYRTH